jgi:hypothetical protein
MDHELNPELYAQNLVFYVRSQSFGELAKLLRINSDPSADLLLSDNYNAVWSFLHSAEFLSILFQTRIILYLISARTSGSCESYA